MAIGHYDWAVGVAPRKWSTIKKRLERGESAPFSTLAVVMDAVMGRKLDSISMGVCPYCGRPLKPRHVMARHLNGGGCGEKLREDIRLALSLRRALMGMVKKTYGMGFFKVCLSLRQDSPAPPKLCFHFKRKLEAVKFLLEVARSGRVVVPVELPRHVDEVVRRVGLDGGRAAGWQWQAYLQVKS